jgi:hypothetical protein
MLCEVLTTTAQIMGVHANPPWNCTIWSVRSSDADTDPDADTLLAR